MSKNFKFFINKSSIYTKFILIYFGTFSFYNESLDNWRNVLLALNQPKADLHHLHFCAVCLMVASSTNMPTCKAFSIAWWVYNMFDCLWLFWNTIAQDWPPWSICWLGKKKFKIIALLDCSCFGTKLLEIDATAASADLVTFQRSIIEQIQGP